MYTKYLLLLILIMFSLVVQAQNSISVPINYFDTTNYDQKAANVYLYTWENNLTDTIVNIYMTKNVTWSLGKLSTPELIIIPDNTSVITFIVDTIVDRGDRRQVMLTSSVKSRNPANWIRVMENYISTNDTITQRRLDTIGITTDSTFQQTVWLRYNSSPLSPFTVASAKNGAGGRYTAAWNLLNGQYTLTIWLEKILGDPTKFKGLNQLCKFHFQIRKEPPQSWISKYLKDDTVVNDTVVVEDTVEVPRNYFIRNGGNDNASGHSDVNAWATISKINATTFAVGDTINFKRGSTLRGSITIRQSGITLQSYGTNTAPAPIISGGILLNSWHYNGGNIWATLAPSLVSNLFVNGLQMTRARYPNANPTGRGFTYKNHPLRGLLPIATTNGSTTITSPGITQPSGYHTGATIHIFSQLWRVENQTVTGYDGSVLTFTDIGSWKTSTNKGFFLDNKKAYLDSTNEYWVDPITDSVYYYSLVNPATLIIEGSVLSYGINTDRSNISVQKIKFDKQATNALNFTGTDSLIVLKNDTITNTGVNPIYIGGTSTKDTIMNCYISGSNATAICAFYTSHSVFHKNIIKYIGKVWGYTNQAYGIIEYAGEGYNSIKYNFMDSIGYVGIFPGNYDTLQYNYIKNSMITNGDGGAVYTTGTQYSYLDHNIFEDIHGNSMGSTVWTLDPGWWESTSAMAIYLDQNEHPPTSNWTITNNTVIRGQRSGLFFANYDSNNIAQYNTFYDCGTALDGNTYMACVDTTHGGWGTHKFTRNIIFSKTAVSQQASIEEFQANLFSRYQTTGRIDENQYASTTGTLLFNRYTASPSANHFYTLSEWRTATNHDLASSYTAFVAGTDSLFYNPTSISANFMLTQTWRKIDGTLIPVGTFTVAPYSSIILIKNMP